MSGEVRREEEEVRLWWEQSPDYWDLPFYADMGLCCDAMLERDDMLAGREQLWALREVDQEDEDTAPMVPERTDLLRAADLLPDETIGGTKE